MWFFVGPIMFIITVKIDSSQNYIAMDIFTPKDTWNINI